MKNWTVLITAAQSDAQPAITHGQSRRILAALGEDDSWVQYPPASGRGHGFETRWWQAGEDAGTVAIEATDRYGQIVKTIGLDVQIVLVHVASPEDRLSETAIGLERRLATPSGAASWSIMLRAIAGPASSRPFTRRMLDSLLALLPGTELSGYARDGLVEVRFWVDGDDAVEAIDIGSTAFRTAMGEVGHSDWTIVDADATSIAETRRTAYLGVERRVLTGDRMALPVAIRI